MGRRGKQRRLLAEARLSRGEEEGSEEEATSPSSPLPSSHRLLGGITEADLHTTIATLDLLSSDLALFRSRAFKRLRGSMAPLAHALLGPSSSKRGRHTGGTSLQGLGPHERLKAMDREATNQRALRAERLARLEALKEEGRPDGPLLLCGGGGGEGEGEERSEGRLLPLCASASCSATVVDSLSLRRAGGGGGATACVPDGPSVGRSLDAVPPATLHYARSCYICKLPFRELHAFYSALCPSCAELNWRKREERADLTGRVALVTGG
ncbi:MAG: hypothetical protein SGPRY_001939, partial [Prymnesium sp.]